MSKGLLLLGVGAGLLALHFHSKAKEAEEEDDIVPEPSDPPQPQEQSEPVIELPPEETITSYTLRVFKSKFNPDESDLKSGLLVFDVTYQDKLVLRYRLEGEQKIWMASPAEYTKTDPIVEDAAFNLQLKGI